MAFSDLSKKSKILLLAASVVVIAGIVTTILMLTIGQTVLYEVTFDATWSNTTNPDPNFPSSPHFSKLIGMTGKCDGIMWQLGKKASDGMEEMAEVGAVEELTKEINAIIAAGKANFRIFDNEGNIPKSPGSVTIKFEINPGFSYVSLVSMIAPSPDWFVGVDRVNLMNDGKWVEKLEIDLHVYDAGTDDGPSFTSPNADSDPPEEIYQLRTAPFPAHGKPLGTFTFVKM